MMDEATCAKCGSDNPVESNFCSVCGEQLDRSSGESTQTHPVISVALEGSASYPVLVVIRGSNAGSRFAITTDKATIGRHPDSNVFLDDVTVSRRHAEVLVRGSKYELVDTSSLNGTYLNGTRIDVAELKEGDSIQVGKYQLVLAIGENDDES